MNKLHNLTFMLELYKKLNLKNGKYFYCKKQGVI